MNSKKLEKPSSETPAGTPPGSVCLHRSADESDYTLYVFLRCEWRPAILGPPWQTYEQALSTFHQMYPQGALTQHDQS
jgi:hypothetical protein